MKRLTRDDWGRLAKNAAMASLYVKRSGILMLPWEKTNRIRRRMWIAVAQAVRAEVARERRRRLARSRKAGGGQ